MKEGETYFIKFTKGIIVNCLITLIFSIATLSILLGQVLKLDSYWEVLWWLSIGNIVIFCITNSLYYWKGDEEIKKYMGDKFSLRPLAYFFETILFVTFFLIRPEVIAGYFILKGLVGYRGEKETLKNNGDDNKAKIKGELNAIKIIGTVFQLLLALIVTLILYKLTPQIRDIISFPWLKR